MDIKDISLGQRVISYDDPKGEWVGTVVSIDYNGHMVLVRWPIPGHHGQSSVDEIDPDDLRNPEERWT